MGQARDYSLSLIEGLHGPSLRAALAGLLSLQIFPNLSGVSDISNGEVFLLMRADIVPGAVFPDYELSDHTATRRKLSELQAHDPMVLVLSRGSFCPKDRRQAEGLVQLHREIEVGYCRLATISTDNLTQTNEYRSGVGAHWPFLSDAGRMVQKDLDIAEYTDPTHNPMIPYTIVLEPGLMIFKIYNGYWFFGRPSIEELRQDLRA